METYYIADLHFGHKNCLSFDSRPFATIEEHDEELIRRWNSVVTPEDEVWILGDVSWLSPKQTAPLIDLLNGTKNLIVGNHDKRSIKNADLCTRFGQITPYYEVHVRKGLRVVLSHYPMPCFNHRFSGWYHLYGHVHTSAEWDFIEDCRRRLEAMGQNCNMINVGCMLPYMDFTPRSLDQIAEGYEKYKNSLR